MARASAGLVVRPVFVSVALALVACSGSDDPTGLRRPSPGSPTTSAAVVSTSSTATTSSPAGEIPIAIRIDRRVDDPATAGFEDHVRDVLADDRGWRQAGFGLVVDDDGPFTLVLAEGPEVDAVCAPYDTGGRFSCQIGTVVALNADRWRSATPEWTGTLDDYRTMLVNHEVGHLIGQHHPAVQCPGPDEPAPVMAQQSTELDGCRPNPWPLPGEISCAAEHVEPVAPPYEADPVPTCVPLSPR